MLEGTRGSKLAAPALLLAECDRFSRMALEKLGLSESHSVSVVDRLTRNLRFEQSLWIDRRALDFFSRHPEGVGIEVDAGLSTRFHRLSENSDWPRFSWKSINQHEIADCLNSIFPQMDNYTNISVNDPIDNWTKKVDWSNRQANLLIINLEKKLKTADQFKTFCDCIVCNLGKEKPVLEVLLTHSIPGLQSLADVEPKHVQVLSEYHVPKAAPSDHFLSRLFNRGKPHVNSFVQHLVFYKSRE